MHRPVYLLLFLSVCRWNALCCGALRTPTLSLLSIDRAGAAFSHDIKLERNPSSPLSIASALSAVIRAGSTISKIPTGCSDIKRSSSTRSRSRSSFDSVDAVDENLKVMVAVEPTPFNYISGYANRFKELLTHLKQAGDEVHVITTDPSHDAPKSFLGIPITSLRGFRFPWYKEVAVSFDYGQNMRTVLQNNFSADVLHVSAPSLLLFPAMSCAKKLNIPLVVSYHTDLQQYAKLYLPWVPFIGQFANYLIKTCLQGATLVLCTSPQLQDKIQTIIGHRRVSVWQKGINLDIFSPRFASKNMRMKLSCGHPDDPLLLYVGRLGLEKRLERLKTILDLNPTVRLAVVGSGPHESRLRHALTQYANRINYVGPLSGQALSEAYASSDVFVMPSDTETLGFVVLEALASGLPVVAVNAGGVVDIVQNETTGFLAKNDDNAVDFAQKVDILIKNPQLRTNMSTTALDWVKQWNWAAATGKLRNVQYRAAMALHKGKVIHGNKHIEEVDESIMRRYHVNECNNNEMCS